MLRVILHALIVLKTLSPLDVGQGLLLKMVWFWVLKPCKGQMRFCHLWRQRRQFARPHRWRICETPKGGSGPARGYANHRSQYD